MRATEESGRQVFGGEPDVLYVLHPYLADKSTGRGHDRYAYEIIRHVALAGIRVASIDSGLTQTLQQAARRELLFPLRLANKGARLFHATASVNARVPLLLRKRPLVTTIHDVIWFHTGSAYDSRLKNAYKQHCIRVAAQRSDLVIVPFASTREFLRQELGVADERIRLVPYGIDHEQFFPNPENAKGKTFPGDRRELRVVFVGQLTRAKGVDTLIEAFATVRAKVANAKLIICSGGWHEAYVRQVWERSPVRDAIELRGHVPEGELRSTFADADVTVFPSRYGFGLPTLESMACATPAVAGRSLDAVDFVKDEALMVDPNSPSEVAAAVVRVLTDAALYEDLSRRGLDKAREYSWKESARRTVDVYRELWG